MLEPYGHIYFHHNDIDGKVYFGQSVDWRKRCRNHFSKLRHYKHYNEPLQQAFHETGGAFTTGSIAVAYSKEELDDLEKFYIRAFNTKDPLYGYNQTTGGAGMLNPTEQTRKKISDANRGRKLPPRTPEHIERIASALRGKKHTHEHNQKISLGGIGRTPTDDTRQKLSRSKSGVNHPNYGKRLADITRMRMSESHKGERNGFYGKTHSPELLIQIGKKSGASRLGKKRGPYKVRGKNNAA